MVMATRCGGAYEYGLPLDGNNGRAAVRKACIIVFVLWPR